jgi:hypothetical protein
MPCPYEIGVQTGASTRRNPPHRCTARGRLGLVRQPERD